MTSPLQATSHYPRVGTPVAISLSLSLSLSLSRSLSEPVLTFRKDLAHKNLVVVLQTDSRHVGSRGAERLPPQLPRIGRLPRSRVHPTGPVPNLRTPEEQVMFPDCFTKAERVLGSAAKSKAAFVSSSSSSSWLTEPSLQDLLEHCAAPKFKSSPVLFVHHARARIISHQLVL